MTSNEGFFARKQAAAVLKHGILSRYPTIFASMAGRGEAEVVLYDAYAGPGKYEDGSPGSPLLLVETAIRTASFRKVRLCFSEEDIDNHTKLQRTLTEAVGSDVEWEAMCGPWRLFAPAAALRQTACCLRGRACRESSETYPVSVTRGRGSLQVGAQCRVRKALDFRHALPMRSLAAGYSTEGGSRLPQSKEPAALKLR